MHGELYILILYAWLFCNAQYRGYDKVCLLFLKSSDLSCLFLLIFLSDDFYLIIGHTKYGLTKYPGQKIEYNASVYEPNT